MQLDPVKFLVTFLPYETRVLTRTGVEIHCLKYWDDALGQWTGRNLKVEVHYDPRDITVVYVRSPFGLIVRCTVTTPDVPAISLSEWGARRIGERTYANDPERVAKRDASLNRSDQLISEAKASRRVRRRKATQAGGDRYRTPAAPTPSIPPLDVVPCAEATAALLATYTPQIYAFEEHVHVH